jgi:hypothetical protein
VFNIIMHKFSWACLLAKNIVAKWMWVYFELMKFTFKVLLHIHINNMEQQKFLLWLFANDRFGAQYYSHRFIRFCLVCAVGSISLVGVANWRFGAQCYLHRWIKFSLVCSFGSVSLVAVANWRFGAQSYLHRLFKFSLVMLIWIRSLACTSSWFLFLGLEFSTTN